VDVQLVESESTTKTSSSNTDTNFNMNQNTSPKEKTKTKRALNSTDVVFEKIRNLHIRSLGSVLHDIAKQIENEISV
jgi:hypothetical protein